MVAEPLSSDPTVVADTSAERRGRWYGRIADLGFSVEATDVAELTAVVALLQRYFTVNNADARAPTSRTVRLRLSATPCGDPDAASHVELPTGSALRVWRTVRGFRFALGGTHVDVDDRSGAATGHLAVDFWEGPPLSQRGLLLVVLLALLPAGRRYGLHANALADPQRRDGIPPGLLISGDSGAGKTTLTLCLVRQGWRFVADDAVALARAESVADNRVTAWGVRRSLSCGLPTARRYPELARQIGSDLLQSDGKLLLNLDAIYPHQTADVCAPSLLLFPEIGNAEGTMLEPLDQTTAFHRLLGQMSMATDDRERAADQLAAVRQLVTQAARYRAILGADVLEQPDRVAAVVQRVAARPLTPERIPW